MIICLIQTINLFLIMGLILLKFESIFAMPYPTIQNENCKLAKYLENDLIYSNIAFFDRFNLFIFQSMWYCQLIPRPLHCRFFTRKSFHHFCSWCLLLITILFKVSMVLKQSQSWRWVSLSDVYDLLFISQPSFHCKTKFKRWI